MVGPVRLAYRATHFSDDEYTVMLTVFQNNHNGAVLYSFGEKGSDTSGVSPERSTVSQRYEIEFRCGSWLLFSSNHCDGLFEYKLFDCGCPKDKPRRIKDCVYSSFNNAAAAICGPPDCERGEYNDGGTCKPCPPGYAKGSKGPQSCKPCGPGTFASGFGNEACKPCLPGTLVIWGRLLRGLPI